MGLRTRLRLAKLYLVTDARTEQGDLGDFLAEVFAGGVDMVRISDPQLNAAETVAAFEVARKAAAPGQRLVVADRGLDLADRIRPDVVHLDVDADFADARGSLHEWALVGCTVRTSDQAVTVGDQADYLSVALPPDQLASWSAEHPADAEMPWFYGGGLSLSSLDAVINAGARRVIVGRALCTAADPKAAAQEWSQRLRTAWNEDPAMKQYTFRAMAEK